MEARGVNHHKKVALFLLLEGKMLWKEAQAGDGKMLPNKDAAVPSMTHPGRQRRAWRRSGAETLSLSTSPSE